MELQVQEHLEAALLQHMDEIGPFLIEERHANLQPFGAAGKHIGKLKGTRTVAVECDDHAIFAGNLIEI